MVAGDLQALRECSCYCRSTSANLNLRYFSHTFILGGFLCESKAGQLVLYHWLTAQTEWTLSKMVKKLWWSWLWLPRTFWIALSSSPRKAFWSPTWPTSYRACEEWWTVLADTSWAWACWSFSTLVVISAMETFTVRFLWTIATVNSFPTYFAFR